jgi:diguanylate cyclase (GGDEF)-like protein/PAS domain S-box-containing protein
MARMNLSAVRVFYVPLFLSSLSVLNLQITRRLDVQKSPLLHLWDDCSHHEYGMSQATNRAKIAARLLESARGMRAKWQVAHAHRLWLVGGFVLVGGLLLGLLGRQVAYERSSRQTLLQARFLTTGLLVEEDHLKEDVLRARYGLVTNGDAVSAHARRIESAARALRALPLPTDVAALATRYRSDAAAEEAQVEAFQAMNASVRHALDAFLVKMRALLPTLPDAGPHRELQHRLGNVVIDVMQQAVEVEAQLPRQKALAAAYDLARAADELPRDRQAFESLAKLADLIERGVPALATSVDAIADSGTRADLTAIQVQLDRQARAHAVVADNERLVALLLVAVAIGGLAFVWIRFVQTLRFVKQERNFLQGLTESISLGVLVIAPDDRIAFANASAERILGYAPGDLIDRHMHDGVHVHADGSLLAADQCVFDGGAQAPRSHADLDLFYRRHDGVVIPVLVRVLPFQGMDGADLIVVFEDVSERKKVEATLCKLSQAIEQSPASIVITNRDGCIEYVNEAFVSHSGYSRAEVMGKNPRIWRSGKTPAQAYESMWATLLAGGTWRGELINRRKDGGEYIEFTVIAPVRQDDGQVTHYVAVKQDITEHKAAQDEIQNLAFFDSLTGLPNRRQIIERIQQAIGASQRSGKFGVVVLLDIDCFKQINDTQGHAVGDRLLEQVAQRLKAAVRTEDVVARLGGDEFIVLAENIGADEDEAALHAERVGAKVLAAMRLPVVLDELDEHIDALNPPYLIDEFARSYRTTASLGLTLFRGDCVSAETLLKQADLAMYKAKDEGRNAQRFYNPDMQRAIEARFALEEAMRRALEHGEFRLHYQPQLDLQGGVIGAEALLRWIDAEGIERSPATFIPVAESSGLILPLGEWVLDTACAQLKSWEASPRTAGLSIAVNVSARQFRADDFVLNVREVVASHGVNPRRLKLELTESMLVGDIDEVAARMKELAAIGIRFSLDDFGTGYSSLAYLKRMPLDEIKVDQSFVRDIEQDPNDASIVRAIIALSDSLEIHVIAEGVETDAQRAFLVRNGCRAFQGFLLGRPMPLSQWDAFLGQGASGSAANPSITEGSA